jgi:hypothetical protein
METSEIDRRMEELKRNMNETATRLRRYTVDERLCFAPSDPPTPAKEKAQRLVLLTDTIWEEWKTAFTEIQNLQDPPTGTKLVQYEILHLNLDRAVDVVQRDLVSEGSRRAGSRVMTLLTLATLATAVVYLVTHMVWVKGLGRYDFEPWPEWGPMKYGEVVFWSTFGCLCYLLFVGAYYLMRRDFDEWYQTWYLATLLRSPFISLILMMVVLEFVEWYADDKDSWINKYLLEEGNKFYFIVFMSFCLGISSDTSSRIMRDLSNGVCEFVSRSVNKVAQKLKLAVGDNSKPTQH